MATTKEILKTYFENGDKPTEDQFAELIDAFLHVDDDLDLVIGLFAEIGEAEAGLVTDKYMSPFLTKRAILALVRLANIPELEEEVDTKLLTKANIFQLEGGPLPLPFLFNLGDIIVYNDITVYMITDAGYVIIE